MSDIEQLVEDPRITKHKVLKALESRKKNQLVTFFLCLFLGFWGAHRFYLGDKKGGMTLAAIWTILVIGLIWIGQPHTSDFSFRAMVGESASVINTLKLTLIWGYAEVLLILDELYLQFDRQVGTRSEGFNLHSFLDILSLAFGAWILWELFTCLKRTDTKNDAIRKELEREMGL